jgi:hypothetical protein
MKALDVSQRILFILLLGLDLTLYGNGEIQFHLDEN